MVARSITKLIDEAVLPAVILILGKMAGLFAAVYFLGLGFTVAPASFLKVLPTIHFPSYQAYILAENFGNLAMFSLAALGTIFVIVRAHFFHESHIPPQTHARLARLNLESLIAPSGNLYYQAAIWLTFLWLSVGFLIVSTIFKITYPQISIIAFVVAANFSWVFALDVERELEIQRDLPAGRQGQI
ncbi:hypothetical protein HYW40_00595 [Candidatus Curtissbacteria bacterium]|nr:hypothetical protein [Candidatus Curtissbacteria bacterium]